TITSLRTVPAFHSMFQYLPEGIHVRCFVKRGEAIREIVLPLQYAHDWYWIQRGVPMEPLQLVQKTASVGQAMSWGAVETGRRLGDVFEFLTILVTGRASPRNLAGPFGIAEVAASEASNSPSRLLLFLTLLSANLAILNFLPIPALDGGHLMFLIAEAIRGKPLNEALQVRLTMVGVICLLGLMAFAILNDILRKVM
ncbi:MAG: site-2 protease family protein, partial [Aureliella sp.]